MAEMKYYRSMFDDTIGMVTKDGTKFNFENRLLQTDDPRVQDILDERVTHKNFRDVQVISAEEAEKYLESFRRPVRTWDDNPDGETQLTPQAALAAAIRLRNQALSEQALESNKQTGSILLEQNQQTQQVQAVNTSATLESIRIAAAAKRLQESETKVETPATTLPFNPQAGIVNSKQLETMPDSDAKKV